MLVATSLDVCEVMSLSYLVGAFAWLDWEVFSLVTLMVDMAVVHEHTL